MPKWFLLIGFISFLEASDYTIPQRVMNAYRHVECYHDATKQCVPYFIRFNKPDDFKRAQSALSHSMYRFQSPYLFCDTAAECGTAAKGVVALGIVNIDLGPYQINYFYQHHRWRDTTMEQYFDMSMAEKRARIIVRDLIDKYGYSWRTLARYHHYDPANPLRNRHYYRKLAGYLSRYENKYIHIAKAVD